MHRRRQHGSSGELDVFGATRYFAGVASAARPLAVVVREPEDMIIKVKTTTSSDKKTTEEEGHRHAGQLAVAGVAKTTNRSKLAAFLGSLVSPDSTSFRKRPPAASSETTTTATTYDDDDEPPPKLVPSSSSSTSSGRTSIDVAAAAAATVHDGGGRHDDDDLGVDAMWEDRRLQGVRVVRCGRCDEERWVVRCGACAWEEHHHHHGHESNAILGAAATSTRYGSQVLAGDREVVGDGGSDWESDSSSDLFELDLEST